MHEERLIELETKVAFQEEHIQALNDVVIALQKQVDVVEISCDVLKGNLDALLKSLEIDRNPNNTLPH